MDQVPMLQSKINVLIAEDDQRLCQLINISVMKAGMETGMVYNGSAVIPRLKSSTWDLLLLDLMLPGKPGLQVLRELRAFSDIPVIILTAMFEERDRIAGFELGADDYLIKPFFPSELIARIHNIFKRINNNHVRQSEMIEIGLATLDTITKTFLLNETKVDLTETEFEILLVLIRNSGRVVDRKTILRIISGFDKQASTRSVDVHISNIRKKMSDQEGLIRTVWGVGYEFVRVEGS
jgi:DNA-binding response OmpR family regulator